MGKSKREPAFQPSEDMEPAKDPEVEDKPLPEEKFEEKPAEEAKAPEPPKAVVPYRVFKVLSGLKPDKFAGFDRYVAREEMRPAPIPEWKERLAAFQKKHVKSLRRK
jgi:hypothetical protein